jgi:hypothetical protein
VAIAALRAARADEDNLRIIYGPEYTLPGNLRATKSGGAGCKPSQLGTPRAVDLPPAFRET